MFYVYEWYVKETNEIFYVGKGCRNRYKKGNRKSKLFMFYKEHFDCEPRIIKYFDKEEDAFNYEYERIIELKKQGLAKANIDLGGHGGTNACWTKEKREKQSTYNPMKAFEQRERMKINNPMKNKEVALKMSKKIQKPIYINNVYYSGIKEAEKLTGRSDTSIIKWCKRGYDDNGNPCRYANEEQKEIPLIAKTHPKAVTYKAVIIDGIRFETVEDGAKYIGVWSESLSRAIKKTGKCKGHTCKYDNQQPSPTNTDKSSREGSTTNK